MDRQAPRAVPFRAGSEGQEGRLHLARLRLRRLLELVEQGLIDIADPTLKERLDAATLSRHAAAERVRALERAASTGGRAITEAAIDRLATALRQALQSDDPAFRKAYLRLFVGQIVVGDTAIRMQGPISALAAATMNGGLPTVDARLSVSSRVACHVR